MTPRQIREDAKGLIYDAQNVASGVYPADHLALAVESLCHLVIALADRIDLIDGAMP